MADPIKHTVHQGDTLASIAEQYHTTVKQILSDNPHLAQGESRDKGGNRIYSGDIVNIYREIFECGFGRGNSLFGCEVSLGEGTALISVGKPLAGTIENDREVLSSKEIVSEGGIFLSIDLFFSGSPAIKSPGQSPLAKKTPEK